MSLLDDSQINLLSKFLDLNAHRQGLVSANIANIDTPGYRTKDINFRSELQRAAQGIDSGFAAAPHDVPGLTERPDGNNVSIDRESMLLSETQLQFRLGVSLMKSEFKAISMAINDGKAA
jgi:flagellar basal-body rod protein FlgB